MGVPSRACHPAFSGWGYPPDPGMAKAFRSSAPRPAEIGTSGLTRRRCSLIGRRVRRSSVGRPMTLGSTSAKVPGEQVGSVGSGLVEGTTRDALDNRRVSGKGSSARSSARSASARSQAGPSCADAEPACRSRPSSRIRRDPGRAGRTAPEDRCGYPAAPWSLATPGAHRMVATGPVRRRRALRGSLAFRRSAHGTVHGRSQRVLWRDP